jgi:cytochrome b
MDRPISVAEGDFMDHKASKIIAEAPAHASLTGNQRVVRFIRISGWCLLILLIVAYATGEEYPHTHAIIGYGIAVLVVAAICWEFFRTRSAASDMPQTAGIAFLIILPILSLLAASALMIMLITHNFWGTTLVDEMHEVVAYFALGLLAFYLAAVTVTSIAAWRP